MDDVNDDPHGQCKIKKDSGRRLFCKNFCHGKSVLRQGSNASKLLPVVLWQGFMEVFCKLVGSEAKVRCFFSENIHDLCVTVSAIARLGCKASLG